MDNQSQTVWIRIAALTPRSGGQQLDTFGVDNFVLNYTIASALRIQRVGDNVVVSWSDPTKFLLYSDVSSAGPWYYADGGFATSPYTNAISNTQRYFNLTIFSPGGS